jgi:hypothetical protein
MKTFVLSLAATLALTVGVLADESAALGWRMYYI